VQRRLVPRRRHNKCIAPGAAGSASGVVCVAGSFVSCGASGQACCQGNTCNGPGCCGDGVCIAAGDECNFAAGYCDSGVCYDGAEACGGLGMDDCPFIDCTAPYTVADPIDCEPCGAEGLPCCQDGYCGPGLGCGDFGDCEPCGLSGQPCCDGVFCVSGACNVFDECP
jgi:hypothetical protein